MELCARDYAGLRRDSRWENELAGRLRSCSEEEKFAFLSDLVVAQPAVALDLSRRCLKAKASFEKLLVRALQEADASSIRYWLECVLPRLGFRRVVGILHSLQGERPENVADAAYWLPLFAKYPGFSRESAEALLIRRPRRQLRPTREPWADQPHDNLEIKEAFEANSKQDESQGFDLTDSHKVDD
jgi:hypothetical protein